MKHKEATPAKEIVEANQQVSSPSLEELQRSHHILETLIAVLPPHRKEELVDLLQTPSRGDGSHETISSVHRRVLQIVSDICKPNPPQEIASPEYGQETEERRQYDRRQK